MKIWSISRVICFSLLFIALQVNAATEGTPISSLPFTITASGMYHLTGNLTQPNTYTNAIEVDANNVTIDLNGFTISGAGGDGRKSGITILDNSNIEIRNGAITNFGYPDGNGVYADSSSNNIKVENVRVVNNGMYGLSLWGKGNSVINCVATGNNSGIVAHNAVIKNNVASNNTYIGISSGNSTVTNNTASENGWNGINNADNGSVVGNTTNNNGRVGILAHSSTIQSNTAKSNGTNGIHGHNSNIIDNTSSGNAGIGIISNGGLIRNNVVQGNAVGIEASTEGYTSIVNNQVRQSTTGINVLGYRNIIEGNNVSSSMAQGIYFASSDNFYKNNKVFGGYSPFAGNVPAGAGDGGGNISSTY